MPAGSQVMMDCPPCHWANTAPSVQPWACSTGASSDHVWNPNTSTLHSVAHLLGAGISRLPISRKKKSVKLARSTLDISQPFRPTQGVGVRVPALQDAYELTAETHRVCASDFPTLAQVSSAHPNKESLYSLHSLQKPLSSQHSSLCSF